MATPQNSHESPESQDRSGLSFAEEISDLTVQIAEMSTNLQEVEKTKKQVERKVRPPGCPRRGGGKCLGCEGGRGTEEGD